MHRAVFCAAIAVALSGCTAMLTPVGSSNYEPFDVAHDSERLIPKPSVKFISVDDVAKSCGSLTGFKKALGCAVFHEHKKSCQIYVENKTSFTVIGHELRHCFEGHFH